MMIYTANQRGNALNAHMGFKYCAMNWRNIIFSYTWTIGINRLSPGILILSTELAILPISM